MRHQIIKFHPKWISKSPNLPACTGLRSCKKAAPAWYRWRRTSTPTRSLPWAIPWKSKCSQPLAAAGMKPTSSSGAPTPSWHSGGRNPTIIDPKTSHQRREFGDEIEENFDFFIFIFFWPPFITSWLGRKEILLEWRKIRISRKVEGTRWEKFYMREVPWRRQLYGMFEFHLDFDIGI